MDGLASTSSLAIVNLSLFSPAISSRTGATILHGPHQLAQKSTTTVLLLLRTSASNEVSVTSTVLAPIFRSLLLQSCPARRRRRRFGHRGQPPLATSSARTGCSANQPDPAAVMACR